MVVVRVEFRCGSCLKSGSVIGAWVVGIHVPLGPEAGASLEAVMPRELSGLATLEVSHLGLRDLVGQQLDRLPLLLVETRALAMV